MIRYLFTTSTSQSAARPSGGHRGSAAKCKGGRGYGLSDRHGSSSSVAVLHGVLDATDLGNRDSSNWSDHRFDLPILGQPNLGQQLERVWWQRSGRYGCTTVPRED